MYCWDVDLDLDEESDCDEIEFHGAVPAAPPFALLDAAHADLTVAMVTKFFSAKDVGRIHHLAHRSDVKTIDDRCADLVYKHEVWRIEWQLKEACLDLYDRLMNAAWALDVRLWQGIRSQKLFPEIEYIVYDVQSLGEPGKISKHRDNESQVTAVVLLSDPQAFEGGINYFEGDRFVKLGLGDAVFFYGDRCYHWITPVTSGRRVVLQMELSRALPCWYCW